MKLSTNTFFHFLFSVAMLATIQAARARDSEGELSKDKYTREIQEIISSIGKEEERYKEIEKEIKLLFPEGTRKSPFYLSIRSDFIAYRGVMKRLDDSKLSLQHDLKRFERLFTTEHFKSVDIIREGDEKWEKASRLSDRIEKGLTEVKNDVSEVESSNQVFNSFIGRMKEVEEFQEELELVSKQVSKELEKSTIKSQNLTSKFQVKASSLREFPAYDKVDSLLQLLNQSLETLSDAKISVGKAGKRLNYLLKGEAKSGEGKKVWELYQGIEAKFAVLSSNISDITVSTTGFQEELEDSLALLREFGEAMEAMDEGISLIKKRLNETREMLSADSIRFAELEATTEAGDPVESSYSALKTAFQRPRKLLAGVEQSLDDALSVRRMLINRAGTVEGSKTADETYKTFRRLEENFEKNEESALDKLKESKNAMEEFWQFERIFERTMKEMDDGLALLASRQAEMETLFEMDRKRYTALMNAASSRVSTDESPYPDLKNAFERVGTQMDETSGLLTKASEDKKSLVSHVGTMEGLRIDNAKYDTFRGLQKEFEASKKKALNGYKGYLRASKALRDVVLENFVNTPQYWALRYDVVEKKSLGGGRVKEENYGYLYDPNEYPDEPYHGKLISEFQLRLRKERERRAPDWTFTLIFEGSNDFPIEGMILLNGDSTVFRISSDEVEIKEESWKEDKVLFEWQLPLGQPQVEQIIHAEQLVLMIHFLTVTHQINHTLYRQKLLRKYEIPAERLLEWRKLVEEEGVS